MSHLESHMIPRILLAAAVSLGILPCAMAQVRVNSVGIGHVTTVGPSNQLLPYIRSDSVNDWNGPVTKDSVNGWRGPITKGYGGDNNKSFNGGVRTQHSTGQ
jgi:hypothetical protein